MPINQNISISRFVPECSFSKTLTIADKGYESDINLYQQIILK